jgi:hypothetical protein
MEKAARVCGAGKRDTRFHGNHKKYARRDNGVQL